MILQHKPPLHLTYCMNIHPGEAWADQAAAIREKAATIRQLIVPDQWFGLGLRLGAQAVEELADDPPLRRSMVDVFAQHQLYPFTVNAFPYGRFHAGPVKENVYAPDWRTFERRQYTFDVCDILAEWLPEGIDGSVSTVPGSFKSWITDQNDLLLMAENLGAVAAYLAAICDDTGKEIHLGLEPEPSCYLETTDETIEFFKNVVFTSGADAVRRIRRCDAAQAEAIIRRHVGVCFDTCHVAVQFEEPADALKSYIDAGIRISKVQLSAALAVPGEPIGWDALRGLDEPTYLHQVKGLMKDGSICSWDDLGFALNDEQLRDDVDEARVHFHIPLFVRPAHPMVSTTVTLTPEFFALIHAGATSHVEIETYTFDVLPPDMHPGDVVKSISREYAWVMEHF